MSALFRLMSILIFTICVCPCQAQNKKADIDSGAVIDSQVLRAIVKGTVSENPVVVRRAYAMLAKQSDLVERLGAKVVSKKIAFAFSYSQKHLGEFGFEMLDKCELPNEVKYDLLISANSSQNRSTRSIAVKRAEELQAELLPIIVARVSDDSDDRYVEEIRMLEDWGSAAASASEALLHRYKLLKEGAMQRSIAEVRVLLRRRAMEKAVASELRRLRGRCNDSEEISITPIKQSAADDLRFDYLHIVYALAEIGPAAKVAMPVALAAVNEQNAGDKEQYEMAGMHCIERILYNDEKQAHSHSVREEVQGWMRNKRRSARYLVDSEKVNRRVDLIFQNHDLLAPIGGLTVDEIRDIEPSILLAELDSNNNQKISKDELKVYAYEQEQAAITNQTRGRQTIRSR